MPLFQMFPSWWLEDSSLLMIDSYFDESGRNDKHLTVVSAYFGSRGDMSALSKRWKKDIDGAAIEYFHSRDFYRRDSGVFRNLSRTRRKHLLDGLLEHVKRWVAFGISAYIDESVYQQITTPRFRSQWGSAYSICVHTVLGELGILLDERNRSQELVNVVLEKGHRNVCQVIEQLKRPGVGSPRILSVGYAAKKDQPALQAADLLAYSICEHLSTAQKPYLFERVRATKKPTILIHCTSEYIEQFKVTVGDYFKLRAALRGAAQDVAQG